jgi:hypothetical protein
MLIVAARHSSYSPEGWRANHRKAADMPLLTEEETKTYAAFITEQLNSLGCLEVNLQDVVWHYTTGDALLSIVASDTLYATQVSCLNDSTELRYAAQLFRDAFLDLKNANTFPEEAPYLERIIKTTAEEPALSPHLPSWWFVTCFSKDKDDLSQWRAYSGSGNGYAIGFVAGRLMLPSHALVRVNYDGASHKTLAATVATTTLQFIREGLEKRNDDSPDVREAWVTEFLADWNLRLGFLGPVVKDPSFRSENEYRIVHQLQWAELHKLRFRQGPTLMSRHLPLVFQFLPLAEVMLGPSHRHREISRVSILTFMQQHGYSVPISFSTIPFQPTS